MKKTERCNISLPIGMKDAAATAGINISLTAKNAIATSLARRGKPFKGVRSYAKEST